MSKSKKSPKSRDGYPKLPAQQESARGESHTSHAIRETIESIVIAFVLAFLFRTFEAEAFVIPTGSMAPTLMGAHKDVDCIKCGHRFRVNASEENGDESPQPWVDSCLAGICPNCRYLNPFRPGLPIDKFAGPIETQQAYNGDRILVNKYVYTVSDPLRWDVVVFKYPGNAQMNYIKRLVGLPGETIRVFQGDLFTAKGDHPADADFKIARKPPAEQMAMRQLVHDTDYDPVQLFEAGWPLRWQPQVGDGAGWTVETEADELTVRQRYQVDAAAGETSWLRYRHFIPGYADWQKAEAASVGGTAAGTQLGNQARPQLVTDFNAYNTRFTPATFSGRQNLSIDAQVQGLHWVGDLMVEADVNVDEAKGELILDLVEAGKHFRATIDLSTGEAALSAEGMDGYAPKAKTAIRQAGSYHVAFANFDDELRLWVNGKLAEFDSNTEYDVSQVFGSRDAIIPHTSESDPGDLAPVGIGARGTKLEISRLQIWRDIYYVADSWGRLERENMRKSDVVTDFPHPFDWNLVELPFSPALWDRFKERTHVDFSLADDQFFVMGDNSPASSDARLWLSGDQKGGKPGGAYLERQLLIGKALCVYWPHSWNRIPGTPIPFPLFPNFEDMRLVR